MSQSVVSLASQIPHPSHASQPSVTSSRAAFRENGGGNTASPSPQRFAFIQSSWHADIVDQARQAFVAEMAALGTPADAIDFLVVPGAFEIPLHAQKLAQSGRYAGIACTGLVVDGGIYRHDFVADAVISALMRVQLDTGVPVFTAVLTPHHFHEHEEHRRYFTAHFVTKGQELARACTQTVASLQKLGALLSV
ncbi:MAG: 6,7-dimethyl-8-ribityllumazine synthase [Comamonadaceae bacterium]|nr:MAG: 6,7-dimethyl-8-ribityllumazine synthase [Comamonadaceae bacterium]